MKYEFHFWICWNKVEWLSSVFKKTDKENSFCFYWAKSLNVLSEWWCSEGGLDVLNPPAGEAEQQWAHSGCVRRRAGLQHHHHRPSLPHCRLLLIHTPPPWKAVSDNHVSEKWRWHGRCFIWIRISHLMRIPSEVSRWKRRVFLRVVCFFIVGRKWELVGLAGLLVGDSFTVSAGNVIF